MRYFQCGNCKEVSSIEQWNAATEKQCSNMVPIEDADDNGHWYRCPNCGVNAWDHYAKRKDCYNISECGTPVHFDEDLFNV